MDSPRAPRQESSSQWERVARLAEPATDDREPEDPWRAVLRDLGDEPPPATGSRGWNLAPRRALIAILVVLLIVAIAWFWAGRPQAAVSTLASAVPAGPATAGPSAAVPSTAASAPALVVERTAPELVAAGTPVPAAPGTTTAAVPTPAAVTAPTTASVPAATPASTPPMAEELVVHVAGLVRQPGIVRLPPGSRVADAIEAAGGVTKPRAADSVNLARPVADGEQIVVSATPAPAAARAPAGDVVEGLGNPMTMAPSPAAPMDINAASAAELDVLPGIGPVLAQRIVDWRTSNGPFTAIDELGEVSGIGDTMLARLRSLVRV